MSESKRALTRVRKTEGSLDVVERVFWVCEVTLSAGCVFRGFYGDDYCEGVSLSELRGERPNGEYLTAEELKEYLESRATVVTREPNV